MSTQDQLQNDGPHNEPNAAPELLRYGDVHVHCMEILKRLIENLPMDLDKANNATLTRLFLSQLKSHGDSISKLIKNNDAKVCSQEIQKHAPTIIAAQRVFVELSNKFYYIVFDPKSNSQEGNLRRLYYGYHGEVTFLELLNSIEPESLSELDEEMLKSRAQAYRVQKTKISQLKATLISIGFDKCNDLACFSKKEKDKYLNGTSFKDHIPKSYDKSIEKRLNQKEEEHYKILGNTAVHSSAFIVQLSELGRRNLDMNEMLAKITLFALAHIISHTALCCLEALDLAPNLTNHLSKEDMQILNTGASAIKAA